MKKQLIVAIGILILTTIACSINNVKTETIDPLIVMVNEALPANLEETNLSFSMTGGEFTLQPGSDKLVEGMIIYNVARWEPQFIRRDNFLGINQMNPFNISGLPTGDVINAWDLALSTDVPLDLTIEGGASKNKFDFTGLQLTNLNIKQGASETEVTFNASNPLRMEQFSFRTGASSTDLIGLGYANFSAMTFAAGAGDYTLDFTGKLTQDATVEVNATISNITIIIPSGMKAVVTNQRTVSNVNTQGTWLLNDNVYTSKEDGPTLTITLDMAVGNVTLIHQED